MAFELTLSATSILNDGSTLTIQDTSDWSQSDLGVRSLYALFVVGKYRSVDTELDVEFMPFNPLFASEFTALTPTNGRYTFSSYAFHRTNVSPSAGDVHVNDGGDIQRYDGTNWVTITLEEAIPDAVYSAEDTLDLPILSYAYSFRNKLNLQYIKRVKYDIQHGADQNRLYYKRTDLDYITALILSAEYNWGLGSYFNFYEIVVNINKMIATGKIS